MYKIEQLSFQYHSDSSKILDGIDLEIKEGEFLVICGKSGCGKTTLLRHLKKALLPNGKKQGTVYYRNQPIETLDTRETKVGYVFQNPNDQIVMDQVWHELAFGLENQGMELSMMKRRVAEIANYFNLQDILEAPLQTLSGGQKQIINLASIMAMNPEVILLDEPTAQLDPIHAMTFIKMLKQIHDDFGVTVVLVEHQLELVLEHASRLLVMDKGKIITLGTCQEVVKDILERQILQAMLPEYMKLYYQTRSIPRSIKEAKQVAKQLPTIVVKKNPFIQNIPLIEVKNISVSYQKEVLKHLHLPIYQHDFLTLVGANGCGKTTVLRCLAGLCKYKGKIHFYHTGSQIGYVPQDPTTLFTKDTVEKEIASVCLKQEEIESILLQMQLQEKRNSHPYDLSGGQMQLLAMAKILSLKPDILLLDEPTKGMDALAKDSLGQILRTLSDRITIVCVSHDLEFCAKYSKRTAMLFNGQIIGDSDTRHFFKDNLFYTTVMHKVMKEINQDVICYQDIVG